MPWKLRKSGPRVPFKWLKLAGKHKFNPSISSTHSHGLVWKEYARTHPIIEHFLYKKVWLVVSTSKKNMKVSWDHYSQYMEKLSKCSKPPTSYRNHFMGIPMFKHTSLTLQNLDPTCDTCDQRLAASWCCRRHNCHANKRIKTTASCAPQIQRNIAGWTSLVSSEKGLI